MSNKILIVTSELKFSGPNNVISSLIVGAEDENIHITPLRRKFSKEYVESLNIKKENIHIQKIGSSIFHIFLLLISLKPKVIHTHGIRADLLVFIISFILNVKQISTIHNLPDQDYIMRYGKFKGNIMLKMHSIFFRSKRVKKVAVSLFAKDHLVNKLSAKNVTYIYNGVDSFKYNPSKSFNYNLLPINNRKKVLFCGHLTEIKDPKIFIESALINDDIDYVLLGSGPLEDYIINYSPKNVYIMGRVDNVVEYLNLVDMFVMPSKTEGMPMAFIEAMLMNLPIVCSDIPIFKELSSINNISVSLFKQGDANDLSEKIKTRLDINDVNNRDVALEYFTASIMAKQYLEVFNE